MICRNCRRAANLSELDRPAFCSDLQSAFDLAGNNAIAGVIDDEISIYSLRLDARMLSSKRDIAFYILKTDAAVADFRKIDGDRLLNRFAADVMNFQPRAVRANF